MSRRAAAAWISFIALVACVRIASTWRVFSQTIDEPAHIIAGFQWLTTARYDLDVEHPPLARIGFALPARLEHLHARPELPRNDQGNELLFSNDRYQHNLALARAGNLPWFLLALTSIALWMSRLFGRAASVVAAALFSLLTPVLAHAGVATTDMAACGSVAFALYALDRWWTSGSGNAIDILLPALAVAVGLLAKFSFVAFFVPAAIMLCSWRAGEHDRHPPARDIAAALTATIVIAGLAVWAAYKFDIGTLNDARTIGVPHDSDPEIAARYAKTPGYDWVRGDLVERYHQYTSITHDGYVDFVDWAKYAGYPSPAAARTGRDTMAGQPPIPLPPFRDRVLEPFRSASQWLAFHLPLPAPMFILGFDYVTIHSARGHSAFLFGRYSDHGWWYYFPVLILLKTPIAFLILAAIGIASHPRFGVTTLAMLVAPILSGINIGIRHVLPVYVPMTIAATAGVMVLIRSARERKRGRNLRTVHWALCTLLAVWLLVASIRAHPDYLADFNELAGSHPERIATDSNLDWGQDMLRFARYVKQHPMKPLHVSWFSSVDLRRFGIAFDDLPPNDRVHGWVAISEMSLSLGPPDSRGGGFKWLEQYPIRRRIGRSIRLYFVP